jgi:hypothetical protein
LSNHSKIFINQIYQLVGSYTPFDAADVTAWQPPPSWPGYSAEVGRARLSIGAGGSGDNLPLSRQQRGAVGAHHQQRGSVCGSYWEIHGIMPSRTSRCKNDILCQGCSALAFSAFPFIYFVISFVIARPISSAGNIVSVLAGFVCETEMRHNRKIDMRG